MLKINITGKTLEEAISKAKAELNVTNDKFEYEILQNGSKGFFGFGAKEFVIEVNKSDFESIDEKLNTTDEVSNEELIVKEVSENAMEETIKFLKETVSNMGIEVEAKASRIDAACISVELIGSGLDIIIGKDGMTLDSLQYLASRVACKHNDSYVKVKLDADNFRKKRKETLNRLAIKAADNACENRIDIKMKPMNPYERRLIHASLQGDKRVKTKSAGSEPFRYVIVSPVK